MNLQKGDKVELTIEAKTDLGYSVLINKKYDGLLFKSDVFQKLEIEQTLTGYIKNIRDDGKIDVSIRKQGYKNIIEIDSQNILESLKKSKNKTLPLTDKSSPNDIKLHFKISKKAFKKAIGNLYKQKKIIIKKNKIELVGFF